MSFKSVISHIRNKARSETEKGRLFEHATMAYLQHSNLWNITQIVQWSNWKHKDGADTGIDLVAETADGELCAVQCKMYGDNHRLSKSDIDSFLEKSSRPSGKHKKTFTHRIIAYIGANITANAFVALKEHNCVLLLENDFENCAIDWASYLLGNIKHKVKLVPKAHQKKAINDVLNGFKTDDRGTLIMACGTGKTFTSLRITEKLCEQNALDSKFILYLVPSLSLMRQTIQEWSANQNLKARYIAVCSDKKVSLDDEDALTLEIPIPVTTDSSIIANFINKKHPKFLTIVFCTYQSLKRVILAQKEFKHAFNLVICDEAHRTTGIDHKLNEHANFTLVHDNNLLKASKRLYMTATDRWYTAAMKEKAEIKGAKIHSMDDIKIYGPTFHRLKFSEAVDKNLLSDYRVLVLNVDEKHLKKILSKNQSPQTEINVDDTAKMIGCWKALKNPEWSSKRKSDPLKKAIVYTNKISTSELFASKFTALIDSKFHDSFFKCKTKHVSGLQNAAERGKALDWIKEDDSDDKQTTCKILSNAKCLGEGIDVPALDAIVFLHPKHSTIDIIQAVGRVMRKPHNSDYRKKFGYVILPVVVPSNKTPEASLNNNERFRTVWEVLRALRSHDDMLDRSINQWRYKETTGIADALNDKVRIGMLDDDGNIIDIGDKEDILPLESIRTKVVEQVGTRDYWGGWTQDIISITQKIRSQITKTIMKPKHQPKFKQFVINLRKTLNESVTDAQALDMLTQHIVTMPIFDALFNKGTFHKNPISQIMNNTIKTLGISNKFHKTVELKPFYKKITDKVIGISDDPKARQELIKDLYGDFFEIVFKNEAKKLGIVYTPIPIIDFMLLSTEYAMHHHFNKHLTNANVNIIDPFTGTGSFIARFLDSELGLLKRKDAHRKYKHELHANEITLMAYYIASVNIASMFTTFNHERGEIFPGLLFTDTFAQNIPVAYPKIAKKITKQKQTKIEVIIGNPPYSDRKLAVSYSDLEKKIQTHYGVGKGVGDSYIRAIMWATDRLEKNGNENGVIAYVTNSGFINNVTLQKMRGSLIKTFSHIYIIDLRGDRQETRGEISKNEGGEVFGRGSRQPIAITIFVKTAQNTSKCKIKYYRMPDKLTKVSKLKVLEKLRSIEQIGKERIINSQWKDITPNKWHDWLDQRDDNYEKYTPLQNGIFDKSVRAIYSGRVSWVYNSSKTNLENNIKTNINYIKTLTGNETETQINTKKLQPSGKILTRLKKYLPKEHLNLNASRSGNVKKLEFRSDMIEKVYLKPFLPQWHYNDPLFNEDTSLSDWFKHGNNIMICVSDKPKGFPFAALVADRPVDKKFLYDAICFPRYQFKTNSKKQIYKISNISQKFRLQIQHKYNTLTINDDDIFYYTYAILNSKQYLSENRNNLKHAVARVPIPSSVVLFKKFSKIGKELAELHLNWPIKLQNNLVENSVSCNNTTKFDWAIDTSYFRLRVYEQNNTKIQINKNRFFNVQQPKNRYDIEGRTPLEWLISHWGFSMFGMKNINGVRHYESGVTNDINLILDTPSQIGNYIKTLEHLSIKTEEIVKTMKHQRWSTLQYSTSLNIDNYLSSD